MNIKRGYFTTLHDGSEYRAVSIQKDKKGNYRIKSTNPDDLNNGFRKYNDTVFVKNVSEDEVEKIISIEPYAVFKNDPDKNKFYIIEKNDGLNYDDKVVLVTSDNMLAKKFDFGPCGYGPGTFEKTVPNDQVEINYDEEKIFLNKSKDLKHQGIDKTLCTMKIIAGQPQEICFRNQTFGFGLAR